MADQFDSPVDVDAEERGLSGLAQMTVAAAVALVTLVTFNAHALAAWTDTLAPGARSALLGTGAHALADQVAARGLDAPRAAMHGKWEQAKAARWPDQAAAD